MEDDSKFPCWIAVGKLAAWSSQWAAWIFSFPVVKPDLSTVSPEGNTRRLKYVSSPNRNTQGVNQSFGLSFIFEIAPVHSTRSAWKVWNKHEYPENNVSTLDTKWLQIFRWWGSHYTCLKWQTPMGAEKTSCETELFIQLISWVSYSLRLLPLAKSIELTQLEKLTLVYYLAVNKT